MRYFPHEYQKTAYDFLLDHREAGLFLGMGLGKTVIALTAAQDLSWDWEKLLVIAPKRPALDTWPEELEKWDHLDLSYAVAVGSKKEREEAVAAAAAVTIINRENVPWLVDLWKTRWPYDFVIIDELSSFKSGRAARFKALRKVRKKVKRIWGLTGTPAGNGYLDLWAECFLLDQGRTLGRTLTGYRDQFFIPGRRNGQIIYEWLLKPGAADEIQDRLRSLCLAMTEEDHLQLPPFITVERSYSLSEKARAAYLRLERESFLELDGKEVDAVNAAVLTGKLLQLSSGEVYDERGEVVTVHSDKLEAFESVIEEVAGENVLVFYQYRHERERLLQAYPDAVDIREPGAIAAWKAGEIPLLLAHPASAGHGLNLQAGGAVLVWYSLPMSLELYQQACKRLHRQGQTRSVRNIVLLGRGTYEERVWSVVLKSKESRQAALINALKARKQEVLQ